MKLSEKKRAYLVGKLLTIWPTHKRFRMSLIPCRSRKTDKACSVQLDLLSCYRPPALSTTPC